MKVGRISFCSFVLALALTPLASLAGPNRWTSAGPEGAMINQIISDPADAAVAYALTVGGGVFKTSNGGERWRAVNDGLPVASVSVLFVLPDAPATLYAASGNVIFISTDAAEHWVARGRLYGVRVNVTSFAFDSSSRTLHAGTNTGVFRSTDGGETWRAPGSSFLGWRNITSLAVSPNGTAYAVGQSDAEASPVLFRSSDHGQTWMIVTSSPPAYKVAVDRESSTIYILAGPNVLSSTDDATTWNPIPSIGEGVSVNSVVPAGTGHLYASSDHGVFEYSDRSGVWTPVGSAITNTSVRTVAISSSTPRRFYAAKDFGVVTSVEHETDWIVANTGLAGAYANDVAVARSQPTVVYTATLPGIFKTEDSGQSWQARGLKQSAFSIEVSPVAPDTAYASVSSNGIMKTTDGGTTWKRVAPDIASVIAVAPSDPATLYAELSTAISKSTDGGETWKSIVTALPTDLGGLYYGDFAASTMAVDPSTSATVYIGGPGGVFKTTDGGARWKAAASDWRSMLSISALAIEGANPSFVYAALSAGGIRRSEDGGATWTEAGLVDKRVLSLAVTSSGPGFLVAGSEDGHVYRTNNGGQNWSGLDRGLSGGSVLRLAFDSSGDHLYAATTAGVYEYHVVNDEVQIERLPDDPLRLPRLLDQLLRAPGATAAPQATAADRTQNQGFVIPIVGTATGVGGVLFTTEVTLLNDLASDQDVVIAWLQEGHGSGVVSSFRLMLPSSSGASGGAFTMPDIGERLGISGIGCLAVIAIDRSGANLDSNASIGGSAHIWTHSPTGRAPLSQSIPAVRSTLFSDHASAKATGFRHDAAFRTNVGIVNLSGELHQFTIAINGERTAGQFTLAVPPFSLLQVPVPNGDYGALSLVVYADGSAARWLFYGSSIDNTTGEARTSVGTPSGND